MTAATGKLRERVMSEDRLKSAAELEQTMRRLMTRVALMLQVEKCAVLIHDADRQQLVARPPALGLTQTQIRALRLSSGTGFAAEVFTSGRPAIVKDRIFCEPDDQEWMKRIEAQSLIAYPLSVSRRDENARSTESAVVGILLVLNKRSGEPFAEDDLGVLSTLAGQINAVIADAQIYLRLTEEKEQLQATLRSILAGIIMVEPSGHISLINSAASEMFDLPEIDGEGRRYDEVISIKPIVELLRAALDEGEETQQEIELPPPPGGVDPQHFQAQTALVRREHDGVTLHQGVVIIFNDITAIRNVERIKTAFVSTVSHELRTPLTSIKGFVATLLQDTDGYFTQEDRIEFYEIIDAECDRLRRLIDDLLNVSRIESGRALQMKWTVFDPIPIIEKVLHAQRSFTDKHQLRLNVNGHTPDITADADKFDQIMTNLVSNAMKYSPAGGDILVQVMSNEDDITISVNDQGIGIPANKIKRIFDKFERVDNRDTREAGGTGIGLFLVKHLVEMHEGTVGVESEVGKGSTFFFNLPLHPAAAAEEIPQDQVPAK